MRLLGGHEATHNLAASAESVLFVVAERLLGLSPSILHSACGFVQTHGKLAV